MARRQLDDLRRVGNLTMSELRTVGKVAIGPGFRDRLFAALDEGRPATQVLVADGDPDIAALLKLVLEVDGHEVIRAGDGEQAMMLALECRPGLCVLDADLAGLDGIQATKLLRAADQTRSVPIVLISTGVRKETIAAGEAAGANAHVIKPFVPDDLLRTVRGLLGSKPEPAAA